MSGEGRGTPPPVDWAASEQTRDREPTASAALGGTSRITSAAPDEWLRGALGLHEGETPFPWQRRLLERFLSVDADGFDIRLLDIPTGLGKTAVMAIWLVARASGARALPRRLVYVVDRRAVVDQATEVAVGLRAWVNANPEVKRALELGDRSLPISTLRGQHVDNREWLDDPARPAIVVGTVDMVGSRLLFEGYGVSRKMRPYHAGLLGADTLVVLDEAHLVPPFEHLLRAVEKEPAQWPVPRLRLLALSATGRARPGDCFGLAEDDFRHSVVKTRLDAKKSLRLVRLDEPRHPGEGSKLEDHLALHAWKAAEEGQKAVRVLVYADSRDVAQKTKKAVEKLAKGDKQAGKPSVPIQTALFVGGRRVFEREEAKERLQEFGFIAGSRIERRGPAFLFATSAGEVGVDLDADHMVCDLVAWERMVQRLGRVNRRGHGEANVIVVVGPKPQPNKKEKQAIVEYERRISLDAASTALPPPAQQAIVEYERRISEWETRQKVIEQLRKNEDGSFDASPGSLLDLKRRASTDRDLRTLVEAATTHEPLRPALTRPLVEAWAMTSLERHPGRPAIQPWLRGWVRDDPPQTVVVWRKFLPVRTGGARPGKQEIEAFFEAAPPHATEFLETETFHVANWIVARARHVSTQTEAAQKATGTAETLRAQDVVAFVLEPDGRLRQSFTLAEIAERKVDTARLEGLTLVVDWRLAGLKDGLLDHNENQLPRTADDGEAWLGEGSIGFRVRPTEAGTPTGNDGNWRERHRFASEVTQEGEATRWLIVEKWRNDATTEEDRSTTDNPQLLDEHQSWAEDRARRLARALGLDENREGLLALAARLHDEGKRATRWQRAFNAPAGGVYAKTDGPINYRILDGYRHELGSLLRVESDERIRTLSDEDRDLVLHLIAAHHGFARPVIGTSGCEDQPPSALEEKIAEIARRFARLQSRWGPWGLAWWEALLRAADQWASRDNDERNASGGMV